MSKLVGFLKSARKGFQQEHKALDLVVLRAESGAEHPPTTTLSLGRPLKILLVEDNPVVQVVTIGMLKAMGCDAALAQSGKIAVQMTLDTHYDLVLMDCKLPDIDGYTVTSTIKSRQDSLELIMGFTSHSSQQEIDRCKKSGMVDVIVKPATVEGFERILALTCKLISTRDQAMAHE